MAVLQDFVSGGILLLLLAVPLLASSECEFQSNIGRLVQRNNTILGVMSDTLIRFTRNATTQILSVSSFNLNTYLQSKGAYQTNSLQYVALGGLNVDWASVANGSTVKDSSIGNLGAHILSVYVIPAHKLLQDLATAYSISYGLFRPKSDQYGFYGMFDNATSNLDIGNLNQNCLAGRRYSVPSIRVNLTWTTDYQNSSSSKFAELAYTLDTFFDQLLRVSTSAVSNDFVRCSALSCENLNVLTYCSMEVYLLSSSDKSADIKKVIYPNLRTLHNTNLASGTRIHLDAFLTIVSATAIPATTVSTTVTPITTVVTTGSTAASSLTQSTSIASTTSSTVTSLVSTSGTSTTHLATPAPTLNTSTSFDSQTDPLDPSTLVSTTVSSTGFLQLNSTATPIILPSTPYLISLFSSTYGTNLTTSVSSARSTYNESMTASTGASSQPAINTTSASISNSSQDISTTNTSKSTEILNSSSFQNVSTTISLTSNASPTNSGAFTSNSTAFTSNSIAFTSNSTASPSNSTSFPFNLTASNVTATNSNRNTSTSPSSNVSPLAKASYKSTTFDPDPFFKAEVPVITKVYNDEYLLKLQVGTMTPLMQKKTFYSITIPAAIGITAAIIVCLVFLQIDCFHPAKK